MYLPPLIELVLTTKTEGLPENKKINKCLQLKNLLSGIWWVTRNRKYVEEKTTKYREPYVATNKNPEAISKKQYILLII